MNISPARTNSEHKYNLIVFYTSEEEYIQNSERGIKISLNKKFIAQCHKRNGEFVLQLSFPSLFNPMMTIDQANSSQIDLTFNSMTKMNQWHQALTRMCNIIVVHALIVQQCVQNLNNYDYAQCRLPSCGASTLPYISTLRR